MTSQLPSAAVRCDLRRQIEGEFSYLCRVARYWQREGANAEDLVQDTVVRALASAHLFAAGSNLRAWLLAIMRNVLLSAAAASARWVPMGDGFAVDNREGTPHQSEGRLLLRDVEHALRRLPQKQRAAVFAIGFEGKSYEEAARTMGTSVAAVRCHLARARSRLRAAIDGGGDGACWSGARSERRSSSSPAAIRAQLRAPALLDAE